MSHIRHRLLQSAAAAAIFAMSATQGSARNADLELWMPVVDAIQAPAIPITLQDSGVGGAGIVIGIVDTGVDFNHPEFAGRIASGGTCFSGATCPNPFTQAGGDDNRHGTHVAGIAAGATVGVAPLALILPVKVLSATGSGNFIQNIGDWYFGFISTIRPNKITLNN